MGRLCEGGRNVLGRGEELSGPEQPPGDEEGYLVFYSVSDKEIVGVAKVTREHYPDPTAKEGDWSVVDLAAVKPMKKPVSLAQIKAEKSLEDIALIKQSRLSVMPITEAEFRRILELGETKVR